MSEARLDQLVKGAPPSNREPRSIPSSGVTSSTSSTSNFQLPQSSDPLATLPSSPPQIYLNLLILEASLRAQYLELRARRRQHTFFLTLLGLWILYFGYALFLAPREDGSGVGGSVYWVIEVAEKVAFMGGIVTGILVWGTGQWERGIRWPRRWVGITNRGLRGFNCKIVVVKGPWWKEWLSALSFIFSSDLFVKGGSSYRFADSNVSLRKEIFSPKSSHPLSIDESDVPSDVYEEDLSPGGDTIKLLLLPKPFSAAFRENWDLYHTEYWERENERRHILRVKLCAHHKRLAAQHKPSIFSWLPFTPDLGSKSVQKDVEKSHHHAHAHSHSQHSKPPPPEKRLRNTSIRSGGSGSHSRTSSRSSTPTPEQDDITGTVGHVRRGSTASTSSLDRERRKKKKPPATSSPSTAAVGTGPTRVQKLTSSTAALGGHPKRRSSAGAGAGTGDGVTPPNQGRWAAGRQSSFSSLSTESSSRPATPASLSGSLADVDTDSVRSLRSTPTAGAGATAMAAAEIVASPKQNPRV